MAAFFLSVIVIETEFMYYLTSYFGAFKMQDNETENSNKLTKRGRVGQRLISSRAFYCYLWKQFMNIISPVSISNYYGSIGRDRSYSRFASI